MTLAKHSASSTEVSKCEVFWPLVFRNFQHSQLFSKLVFTVRQHLVPSLVFARIPILFQRGMGAFPPSRTPGLRASLLYSSTVRVRSGAVFQHCLRAFPLSGIGSCARVPTLFYHVCLAKVQKCIQCSILFRVHFLLIAYIYSTDCVHLQYSVCVYFYCVPVLLGCSGLLLGSSSILVIFQ